MIFKTILLTTFSLSALLLTAQTGKISGKIIDGKTGETLPGATILVEGTTNGASTDFDGNFIISNVKAGVCTVIASYITYDNKKISGIVINANDVTKLNIALEQSSSQSLGEVTVEAEMTKDNTNALFVMQKNNASVSDGISSESIKKTPDRSTSDVLKRVSGASIQDNKFAVIRGMNDRYNAAYINGSPLPSSEADKRAFAFDIFPSAILDNLIILKTATPDLPGDFAGGVIQINTKSIPDKNATTISISGGYNTLTTFKKFKTYEGGKTNWLGLDDGTRQLPGGILPTEDFNKIANDQKIEQARLLNYDWTLKSKQALPNLNILATQANVFKLFKRDFGSIFALTYNSNNQTSISDRRDFEESGDQIQKFRDFRDTAYTRSILSSAMWNLSYKLNQNNQLSLKNLYSINSTDITMDRKGGVQLNISEWERSNVRFYTQNNILSSQLNGDHFIPFGKMKIRWNAGFSDIKRDVPNLRKMVYRKSSALEDDETPYAALIQDNSVIPNSAGSMFFSKTNEKIVSAKYDISKTIEIKKSKHEIKIGGFHQIRNRDFSARLLGYTYYRRGSQILPYKDSLGLLNEGQIFAPTSIGIIDGPGRFDGGLKLSEATTNLDSYKAGSNLHAGYVMSDSRFGEKLRFIYGARIESYNQSLTTYNSLNEEVKFDTTVVDILPSINAVYSITEQINLRAAYYKTVNRPEFRELAPFNFYDFITDFSKSGNPNLQRATINNYDLRFELYPKKPGQIFSVSGFYKDITNPIEEIATTASQIRSTSYVNAPKATNIGFELEYRVKLSTLFGRDSSEFFNGTTLFTNFSYVKSKVDLSNVSGSEERPLQGQSPIIINAGLQHLNTKHNFGVSLSYNYVGRRIVIVGNVDEPNIWENPRHILDLQLSKVFKDKIEFKLNFRDAIAQNLVLYQDINKNGKFDKASRETNKGLIRSSETDNIMLDTRYAPTISLSFSYRF